MSRPYFDYGPRRQRNSLFGAIQMWSITIWLVAINVAVYVVDQLSNQKLTLWGAFSATTALHQFQLWRFLTFQFLHANNEHIIFNMIALYFFGPIVEDYLGRGRYLAFYLLCGVSGAATYMLLMRICGHALDLTPDTPLVGASAGIFGILIASVRVVPDARVMLLFPPIPMKLRTVVWLFIGWAVLAILREIFRIGNYANANAGGEAAHLGGALLGFILIRKPQLLKVFDFGRRRWPPRGQW
ncbi:MAG TPA: rhomboid family intramembrane serine protease [Humisphaera sp.]|jgi:membrane associated rhomboid family serine protease|nr:rhomboid family intramembrane serine protease [Humisphaera sp.]